MTNRLPTDVNALVSKLNAPENISTKAVPPAMIVVKLPKPSANFEVPTVALSKSVVN